MRHRSSRDASARTATADSPPQGRRRHHRQKVRNLAYFSWDSENRGVLRDVSESGAALQVLGPLHLNQQVHFRLELASPRLRVEGDGRVAWNDSLGQAGMEFLDVPPRAHRLLKDWIFTQILADAQRAGGDPQEGLLFSFPSRPAIRLEPTGSRQRIHFLGFRVTGDRFARIVDCLALLCAVLLFNVLALTMTDMLPSWPVAVLLVLLVTGVFAGLYWCMFSRWFGVTPGHRLAQLAFQERAGAKGPTELRTRFR